MPSKRSVEQTKQAYLSGNKGKAFTQLGKMRNEHLLSKEEKKILTVAGEMLSGNVRFYSQLGYDLDEVSKQAEEIFCKHYSL